jgi:hypothetical protein
MLASWRKLMLQRLICLLTAFSMMILTGSAAVSQGARRSGQETFISRAVFADGQLWLLSDAGDLWSIAEGKDEPVTINLPEPALDLWIEDRQPAVITCVRNVRNTCREWTLRSRRSNGEWRVKAKVATEGDGVVSVTSAGSATLLLTTRRIIDLVADRQSAIALSRPLGRRAIATTHATPTSIFLGFNAGEFGGGLQRIDRKTGDVVAIESNESGDLCGGPLNTECDPVNGIATIPWNPDCVAVAIGLVHFAPHGRIVEVCDSRVRRLYVKAHPLHPKLQPPPGSDAGRLDREPYPSVAFFGLVRQDQMLWAVGIDGISQFGPDGAVRSEPLPAFKNIGGFGVSLDLPNVVLVLTNINQRRSISGSVPMLVPR